MSSKMVGVEIGSSTLKMAVFSGSSVKNMAVKRMPEDLVREGKITAPAAMVEFIKEMRKEYNIPSGHAALVLPGQAVISHHVVMPKMSEPELQLNLPFEFRDFVGKEGSKFYYDYSVMSMKEETMELYAAAVRQATVEEYYDIFKKAGLTLKLAIPAEMAWMNLVDLAKDEPKKICIVDIGHGYTRVNIFSNGNFVMGKDIEMGGFLLDETIASAQGVDNYVARTRKEADMNQVLATDTCVEFYQALAIEVMKAVNFYSYSDVDTSVALSDIYYCGGSSVIEPLRNAILKATGLTMHHIHRLIPGKVVGDQALSCALAAGAAVQKV